MESRPNHSLPEDTKNSPAAHAHQHRAHQRSAHQGRAHQGRAHQGRAHQRPAHQHPAQQHAVSPAPCTEHGEPQGACLMCGIWNTERFKSFASILHLKPSPPHCWGLAQVLAMLAVSGPATYLPAEQQASLQGITSSGTAQRPVWSEQCCALHCSPTDCAGRAWEGLHPC